MPLKSSRPQSDAAQFDRRDALKAVASLAALPLFGQPPARPASSPASTRDRLLDDGWRFHPGDVGGAEAPSFRDADWRVVNLPHDWSIEDLPAHPESTGESAVWAVAPSPARVGPFDRDLSEGRRSTGWVVGGVGWYRKSFSAATLGADRLVELRFDGVYMNCDVWLNGRLLGNHPYGYTAFAYDISPYLRRDGENVVAVRVRNQGKNSRWYSGSGIYRHVWLTVTGDVRVPLWSLFVTTPEVSAGNASVKVAVRVENRAKAERAVDVRIRLLDSNGVEAARHESKQSMPAGGEVPVEQVFAIASPKLWSSASPHLYHAEVDLVVDGKTSDHIAATFGIRKIELDAELGLRINGEPVKLRGGCVHHDNGVLGSAAFDRADERRVELMKANGFNAIRCSHNPPSPAFLDACDRLGILVIDEAFDMWEKEKNPQDYHLYFKEWWQRDLDSMVLRDRNHPSIIFWSIGNEIPERAEPAGAALAKQLGDRVKQLDATRPVTAAVPFFFERGQRHAWADSDAAFQHLDASGYNYQWKEYESDHGRLPKRVIMGTESFPIEAFENWRLVEKHAYVLGDFVWTAMDYLGESGLGNAGLNAPPSPFAPQGAKPAPPKLPDGSSIPKLPGNVALLMTDYPWFNAYCGDIDLIGDKKPQGYFRDVVWGRSKLEMAVQRPVPEGRTEEITPWGWSDELRSWTWPGYEAKPLNVRVYSSGDEVRLLLNGKEIGVKPVTAETKLQAEFSVPYAPGELRAIALLGGRQIAEMAFKTVGRPAKLRLKADRESIRRSRSDLAFITLDVVDQNGDAVPDAVVDVTFDVRGAGELAGVGNANPKEVASFRQPHRKTYHGKCLVVVRPTGIAGAITVRAEAAGIASAVATIRVS